MPETRKLRIFLCHASQDKPIVRELYQKLLAEGWIDPWLDEEKLLPGQDWDMEIEKAVESADVVIVCLSNHSVTKDGYVQRELKFVLDIALEKPEGSIFTIPLRLNDCETPRRLRSWQYVDYFPDEKRNNAYGKLKQSLNIRLESLKKQESSSDDVKTKMHESNNLSLLLSVFDNHNQLIKETSKATVPVGFTIGDLITELRKKKFLGNEEYDVRVEITLKETDSLSNSFFIKNDSKITFRVRDAKSINNEDMGIPTFLRNRK
jgi:hypothetical protein